MIESIHTFIRVLLNKPPSDFLLDNDITRLSNSQVVTLSLYKERNLAHTITTRLRTSLHTLLV